MMKRNFMDKLLDGVEVVWTPLGEVADYEQPTKYLVKSQNYSDDFKTPVLTAGKTFILGYTDETNGIYNASKNPVIIFDDFTTANKWVDFDFKAKSSAMKMITSKNESVILLRYIYHWINMLPSGLIEGDHKRQWISNYSYKLIPIPPLNIQAEIVRILDTFTELTAELTAELEARKKQYNYYREQLLTFEEGEVEWKPLGETLVRTKGTKITAGQMKELHKINAPLKIFAGGKTIAFVDFEDIPKKDINREPSIIVKSRGNIEFEYYDKPFSHKNEMWSYHSKNKNINIKFVYYFLKINELYFQNIGSRMQMPQIATPDTDKFKIPVPPIEEQDRIVSILDKFDALTSSITEGLPCEIELRQKQYEYYRNMLLSFPKEEVEK
ncbi:restriction endonuclease subunit S [Vagococcus lutrae]|uniref:restriction endonuclease subunit S n=1 Tax=Vagococcus lutrae TaxID=81947 RepID=UPI0035E2BAE1